MAEINTTPLVDVMLVLLVIFIVTAPLFHQAVPVDLPRVDSTKLDDKPLTITVAINGDGQVYVDGVASELAALPARFSAVVAHGLRARHRSTGCSTEVRTFQDRLRHRTTKLAARRM
jgi:biopolymer transport protein ExbD